jgi:hypothetical protein
MESGEKRLLDEIIDHVQERKVRLIGPSTMFWGRHDQPNNFM